MKSKAENKIFSEVNANIPNIKDKIKNSIDWDAVKTANESRVCQNTTAKNNNVEIEDNNTAKINVEIEDNSAAKTNVEIKDNSATKKTTTRKKWFPIFISSFSAAVVLILCVSLPMLFNGGGAFVPPLTYNEFFLTLSVNPKVELTVSHDNIVTKQKGLNEDGIKLLFKENLVGKDAQAAANRVVELCDKYGYIKDNKPIKISVFTPDKVAIDSEFNSISDSINNFARENNIAVGKTDKITQTELNDIYDYYNGINGDQIEESLVKDFSSRVKAALTAKINEANAIVSPLKGVTGKEGDLVLVEDKAKFQTILAAYSNTYGFLKGELDFDNMTVGDAKDILSELLEELSELDSILTEINSGKSEDDFSEQLEDILDIAKDSLFDEDDGDGEGDGEQDGEGDGEQGEGEGDGEQGGDSDGEQDGDGEKEDGE